MSLALRISDQEEYQFDLNRGHGGRVSCISSGATSVVRLDRSQDRPVPEGAKVLDTFLDEFLTDPEIAAHLPAARQELADDFRKVGMPVTLRTLRLKKGHSQAEFASLLGTSQAAVSAYEARQRKPNEEMIRKFAEALEVDFNTLMDALANG